ncbi:HAD-like protein [Cylindrobasidium torrendii FP15055 ss-10]|uniref:HAD-like protein n=1 Tax=Cylindrobasidium torrendii FP15055 ss-10 TaxID=1314674 RepID=A0A0D7B7L0_9AGAR|nr:HAD-like protein [Cylindrobasidium torrendii FP15055 ss-10]
MPSPISYVLFDMDGLLLDTESVYTDVTNAILAPHGVTMTWDIKAGCMGKPERAAAEHLLSQFPGIPLTMDEYLVKRNLMQDETWPHVPFLPGAEKLIRHLAKHGIPICVATGSRRSKYELKTSNLRDVFDLFGERVVCGDDDLENVRGKPNPDIFVVAARDKLHVDVGPNAGAENEAQLSRRKQGLVFEDGLPGMQAGKRAGMNVIWVPDQNLLDVAYDGEEKADQVLRSLEEFKPEEWSLPPYDS